MFILSWIIQVVLSFLSINFVHGNEEMGKLFETIQKIRLRLLEQQKSKKLWSYDHRYKTTEDIFLDRKAIYRGMEHKGFFTKEAIRKTFLKALNGEEVSLYIFGESVSVGADLGKDNKKNTFHYAVAHWWNETFASITGSRMLRRVIAVGGVSTSYFDRCWQEYLMDNETFDMAMWEFNINDGHLDKDENKMLLERFATSMYYRYHSLDLIYVVFYHRNLLERRHDTSEDAVLETARYYNLTCLNIEPLLNNSLHTLTLQNAFTKQHPSILSHVHMATLIIYYYIDVILELINGWHNGKQLSPIPVVLPSPKFLNNSDYDSVCWNEVTFDWNKHQLKHSLFSLPSAIPQGFTKIRTGWKNAVETRFDYLGGYETGYSNKQLLITFNVTKNITKEAEISVAVRFQEPNRVNIRLMSSGQLYFDQEITTKYLSKLVVIPLTKVYLGVWTLQMKTLETGNIRLCAIIIC